jgi:hypothetical protein
MPQSQLLHIARINTHAWFSNNLHCQTQQLLPEVTSGFLDSIVPYLELIHSSMILSGYVMVVIHCVSLRPSIVVGVKVTSNADRFC